MRKIIAIHQASREEGILMPMMTEPCRTFFKQVATPLQKCLQNHFDNNLSEFLKKHTKKNGKLLHSKFIKICAGNGCNCEQSNVLNNSFSIYFCLARSLVLVLSRLRSGTYNVGHQLRTYAAVLFIFHHHLTPHAAHIIS